MMVGMMGWESPKQGWRKGPWTPEEDKLLTEYVNLNGEGRWTSVSRSAGLNRSGKSCRLRWVNYLRPGLKRGHITPQEEGIIIELHALWGNKWSTIARYLPGRTDNEIKNYWRTHFKKKERSSQKQQKRIAQILKVKQQQKQEEEEAKELPQPDKDQTAATGDGILNSQVTKHDQQLAAAQGKQEIVFMYPTLEDQCMPIMYQEGASCLDQHLVDEGFSVRLWNLDDDYPYRQGPAGHCNKIAMQNQANTACYPFGGDATNIYNGGGYIF